MKRVIPTLSLPWWLNQLGLTEWPTSLPKVIPTYLPTYLHADSINPRVGEHRRPCHLWNPRSESVTTMPHLICCSCLLLAHSFGNFFNIIDAPFAGNWCLLLEPLTLLQKSLNLITRLLHCYHLVLPICVLVQLYLKLWEIRFLMLGCWTIFKFF
jgi:hypothetical protein